MSDASQVHLTLEYHDAKAQEGDEVNFSFVWLREDFFWDKVLNRPKGFPTYQAHLYAAMMILSGKHEYIYVQRCSEYWKKHFNEHPKRN